jgi:hypothetical protein
MCESAKTLLCTGCCLHTCCKQCCRDIDIQCHCTQFVDKIIVLNKTPTDRLDVIIIYLNNYLIYDNLFIHL